MCSHRAKCNRPHTSAPKRLIYKEVAEGHPDQSAKPAAEIGPPNPKDVLQREKTALRILLNQYGRHPSIKHEADKAEEALKEADRSTLTPAEMSSKVVELKHILDRFEPYYFIEELKKTTGTYDANLNKILTDVGRGQLLSGKSGIMYSNALFIYDDLKAFTPFSGATNMMRLVSDKIFVIRDEKGTTRHFIRIAIPSGQTGYMETKYFNLDPNFKPFTKPIELPSSALITKSKEYTSKKDFFAHVFETLTSRKSSDGTPEAVKQEAAFLKKYGEPERFKSALKEKAMAVYQKALEKAEKEGKIKEMALEDAFSSLDKDKELDEMLEEAAMLPKGDVQNTYMSAFLEFRDEFAEKYGPPEGL